MNKYYPLPIFLNVNGQTCVIVGGGTVALRKVTDLIEAGAIITVIAKKPSPAIERFYKRGEVKLVRRRFRPDDLDGAFLVFAATDNMQLNAEISAIAKQRGILVNVVDSPELCNFTSGAVAKRGPLRIAISTSGCCPAIAARIRCELEQLYPESYGEFIRATGELRQYILSLHNISDDAKQTALKWLARKETFTLFVDSGKETVWEKLKKIIFSS